MICQVTQLVKGRKMYSEGSVVSVRCFKNGPLTATPHLSRGHGGRGTGSVSGTVKGSKLKIHGRGGVGEL